MLEQEVVSERDLRSKSDRTKDDVERDLVDALEQLRIANLNNASKDKDLTVSKHLILPLTTLWRSTFFSYLTFVFSPNKLNSTVSVKNSKKPRLIMKFTLKPSTNVKTWKMKNLLKSMTIFSS